MPKVNPNTAEQMPPSIKMAEAEEWFDLLPAEKKLIGWSLGIGIVLLVFLIFISGAFER